MVPVYQECYGALGTGIGKIFVGIMLIRNKNRRTIDSNTGIGGLKLDHINFFSGMV
jgi:hypothetical protein